jgi:hypothetical protein
MMSGFLVTTAGRGACRVTRLVRYARQMPKEQRKRAFRKVTYLLLGALQLEVHLLELRVQRHAQGA